MVAALRASAAPDLHSGTGYEARQQQQGRRGLGGGDPNIELSFALELDLVLSLSLVSILFLERRTLLRARLVALLRVDMTTATG